MDKRYYNWEELLVDIKKLCFLIDGKFDCIVGISKGGIIPAGLIAQTIGSSQVYLISYRGGGEGKKINSTKNIHQNLKNKKILLVDDVSDSGDTLLTAKYDLEKLGNQVTTACLHYKPHTKLVPNYYASKETVWVVYPWEVK